MDCSPPGSSVHRIPRQKYWSGLPFPSPGDLSDPGIKPVSPVLADESLISPMELDIHQLKMRMWGGVCWGSMKLPFEVHRIGSCWSQPCPNGPLMYKGGQRGRTLEGLKYFWGEVHFFLFQKISSTEWLVNLGCPPLSDEWLPSWMSAWLWVVDLALALVPGYVRSMG